MLTHIYNNRGAEANRSYIAHFLNLPDSGWESSDVGGVDDFHKCWLREDRIILRDEDAPDLYSCRGGGLHPSPAVLLVRKRPSRPKWKQ